MRLLVFIFSLFSTLATFAANGTFPTLAPMLEKTMPAIVNVAVQGTVVSYPTPSKKGRRYPQVPKPKKFFSIGSGVIIDSDKGYIVTNAHVIRNAKTINVTLHDGRRIKAKLIGADDQSDLAVLQIKGNHLVSLSMFNKSSLKVGDFVVAIGNPFGLNNFGKSQSATFGIVSALQRNNLNIEGVENFIQTDAAINPGNSGGALVNTKGELVGINTAIIAPFGGNIGIGFAIPIKMTIDVVNQIIKYGSVNRGLMGIFVQHLTPELAEAFKLPPNTHGALITQVNEGSPAAKAGLKVGDIIIKINNTNITDSAQVKTTIGLLRVGTTARITLIRNHKTLMVNAMVSSIKQNEQNIQAANPFLFGLALSDFKQQSPLHGIITGVQVMGASERSAGWRAGLRPGDVIISVNHQKVSNLRELHAASRGVSDKLLIHILRGPGALYLVIK